MRTPALAVDIIIEFPKGEIVLVERKYDPYKGYWALPGGAVEIGEMVEQAAVREAKEETGLDIRLNRLVGVYSKPDRDPRGHVVSIVYHATPIGGEMRAETDANQVIKINEYSNMKLAFDHQQIIRDTLTS